MKTVAMMRVKNEARWIEQVVCAALPVVSHVYVLDDNSDDDTARICAAIPGVTVLPSPFAGLNESRDKQWLLEQVGQDLQDGDWILHIDGDEELVAADRHKVMALCSSSWSRAWAFRILYLWDRPDQIRVDRWYSTFMRPSLFKYSRGQRFLPSGNGGNFHCGNSPHGVPLAATDIRLLHYGYMYQADRVRKYHWYNAQTPVPLLEDGYRHMVVGDLFPKESRFLYAGPLELAEFHA